MTKLITILFICLLPHIVGATTYYVSSAGSSSNNGTTTSTTWNLAKVNSFAFSAGDNVLFNRGDVFYGTLTVSQSGTSGNPITFGAYGSGANPIITGYSTLTSWTANGGGVYYATVATNNTMIATWDGSIVLMGRTPYYYYSSHSGSTQISGTGLTGTPNWTGANIVMRNERWIIDNFPVTAQSGATVTFDNTSPLRGSTDSYSPLDGGWFFFQNSLSTLDTTGEWYTNSGKFYIYGNPAGHTVQVSLQDYNINLQSNNYITIQNIDLTGASYAGIKFTNNTHITINGVNSTNQGGYFVFGKNTCSSILINNCTAINSLAGGIHLDNTQVNVLHSTFINSGLSAGNQFSGDGFGGAVGLTGSTDTVMYNTIRNCGYEGIKFQGSNVLVQYNTVDSFGLLKTDCGGIYNSDGTYSNSKIFNNIVSNGIGTDAFDAHPSGVVGIYCDNGSRSGYLRGNTVFNIGGSIGSGFFFQNDGYNWTMDSNTVYNAYFAGVYSSSHTGYKAHNLTFTNNIIVSVSSTVNTFIAEYYSTSQRDSLLNVSDYNYYLRPINETKSIALDHQNFPPGGDTYEYYGLSDWQSLFGKDAHSNTSPKSITSPDSMRLVYNPHLTDTTISLPYKYLGHDGTTYDGSITLHPFTSEVLIQNGSKTTSVAPPTITLSGDQTITATSTTVFSTASAASGHSITYLWTKTSGGSATIVTPTTANTSITGLSTGTYVFRCTVTQDDSQTAYAEVTITVTASNVAPTANAGTDQVITLPTSSVSLTGSGTDTDGTISSYSWSKVSGGAATFSASTSANTDVTGLTEGTYVFQLTVTDNDGATGTDQVTITVHGVPVMDAGRDTLILANPVIFINKP